MSSRALLDIIAAISTVLSLIVSVSVVIKDAQRKSKENASKEVLRERLDNIATNLRIANTNLQILIRRADGPDVQTAELQNLARTVRTTTFGALDMIQQTRKAVSSWKFGEMLESVDIQTELEVRGDENLGNVKESSQ